MKGQTVTVYNQSGRRLLSYDNAFVDNDIDPPYVIIRNADTTAAIALVPVGTFILELTETAEESLIHRNPPVPYGCHLKAACSLVDGHFGPCILGIHVPGDSD